MYIPGPFILSDQTAIRDLIARHPFATLVVTTADGLVASHLPLIARDEGGTLVVYGHLARANHGAQAIGHALAVFHGPHAYIPATWYDEPDTVPTWNYLSVHAYGPMEPIDDPQVQRDILARLAAHVDERPASWQDRLSDATTARLLTALAFFRMPVARLEAKAKLSQNHSAERRAKVIAALRARGGADDVAVAQAMEQAARQ